MSATAPPAPGVKVAAACGPVAATQFPDGTLSLVAHGSALLLKPADARFVARVLAAMYLVDGDDGK